MAVVKGLVFVVAALALLVVLMGQLGLFKGKPPNGLGVTEGRLKRPSYTPNSVSSQARAWPDHPQREAAQIEPLALAAGDGAATMVRLRKLVEAMRGSEIVESRPDYLRVQFTTRLLGFVDDAEFWHDAGAGVIQLRSASRVGRKDYGVNRERIEALRAQLAAAS